MITRPGVLERGDRTTRLESFVDAAFAFTLTLLVISGERIPESSEQLIEALKRVPAYAASFLLVLKFWSGHVAWSRRYGLDDAATRRLSMLLVFLVLIFVYPMRMVFAVLFSAISGGYFPAEFKLYAWGDVPELFVVFGAAFGSLGATMALLYGHAWRQRDALQLNQAERIQLRYDRLSWALVPVVAAISIVSALLVPARAESGWWLGLPGFLYFTLNLTSPLLRRRAARRIAALSA